MKKYLVTSSLIAILLVIPSLSSATPTDRQIVASKAYVDTKQNKIPVQTMTIGTGNTAFTAPLSLVSYPTTTDGAIGQLAVLDGSAFGNYMTANNIDPNGMSASEGLDIISNMMMNVMPDSVPTSSLVGGMFNLFGDTVGQIFNVKIPASGQYDLSGTNPYTDGNGTTNTDWLNAGVKGTGVATRTGTNGVIGERKIFESTDVANYHATGLNQIQKDIQDISIPTMGAVMTAINAHTPATLSWTSTETTATQGYSTTFDDTTGNWPTADANKLVDTTALASALALKQNKIPAGTHGANNSVITYDATSGTTQERWILGAGSMLPHDTMVTFAGNALSGNDMNNLRSLLLPGGVVPTLEEVKNSIVPAEILGDVLGSKQTVLGQKASNAHAQAVTRSSTAGYTSSAYITAGGSVGLTTQSGAPAIINYVNGTVATDEDFTTFTNGTFGTATGNTLTKNKNYIKNALVSLELLKDVYGELNTKIANNALPTGTTGTVVTYNGTNAQTGVQEFTETAIYSGPTAQNPYNATNDAGKLATAGFVESTKQDKIPAKAQNVDYNSVLTDTSTDGVVGKMQIVTSDYTFRNSLMLEELPGTIPTSDAVFNELDNYWQQKIPTGRVLFHDGDGSQGDPDVYVPALVSYGTGASGTDGILGNKIGILDQETIDDDEGDLSLYSNGGGGYGSEMDNFVPTVRAVANALHSLWDFVGQFAWIALSWDTYQSNAINAYNTTFTPNGANNTWKGDSGRLINGQFLANSLALKQNKLPEQDDNLIVGQQVGTGWASVLAPTTVGNVTQIGLWDADGGDGASWDLENAYSDATERAKIFKSIPTVGAVKVGLSAVEAELNDKQNEIPTGLVEFIHGTTMLPTIATYGSTWGDGRLYGSTNSPNELSADKIGILDYDTMLNDNRGDLFAYSWVELGGYDYDIDSHYEAAKVMDKYVPTARAVAESLYNMYNTMLELVQRLSWSGTQSTAINAYNTTFGNDTNNWAGTGTDLINGQFLANSLALKQNKLAAKTSNARAQAVTRSTAGNTSSAYITAGGSVGLTTRSGAPAVINYVNGTMATTEDMTTFTTGTFGSSNTTNQNYIKNALVSLELLKDVYSALHNEIASATPTGTANNVAMYDANGALGDGRPTADVADYNETTGELENGADIATIAAVETKQDKMVCAGYAPDHLNDPDYCWLWRFAE